MEGFLDSDWLKFKCLRQSLDYVTNLLFKLLSDYNLCNKTFLLLTPICYAYNASYKEA